MTLSAFRFLLILSVLFPILAYCRGNGKQNIPYVQLMVGRSALGESDDVANGAIDDQTQEASTAMTGAIGYRWEHFSLELIYAFLGTPSNDIGEYYTEEHKVNFIGGGLHWTWSWFDLKVGWGSASDTVSYKKGPNSTTFSADPNKETTNNTAGYFGLGLNFDLGTDTEFVIDYTGYGWTSDEPQHFSLDGQDTTNTETTAGIGVFSIGLRWFM